MNNFAISTDELAQGLQKSASTLSLMGNSIDEAAALITAANTTIQDVDSVSAGIRTVTLRIMGTEEAEDELQELGEEVDDYVVQTASKKQQIIKDYTAVASNNGEGIDILDDNGNYKNVYTILKEISEIYEEIQEEDKKFGTNRATALIEELAGKNRSSIVSAILSNGDILEAVKSSSENADGSAEEELEKYLDSIEGGCICPIIWKHINGTYLIAGNSLEPCTTIVGKPDYESLTTQGLDDHATKLLNQLLFIGMENAQRLIL